MTTQPPDRDAAITQKARETADEICGRLGLVVSRYDLTRMILDVLRSLEQETREKVLQEVEWAVVTLPGNVMPADVSGQGSRDFVYRPYVLAALRAQPVKETPRES